MTREIADFELQIADWASAASVCYFNLQSEISNLKSLERFDG